MSSLWEINNAILECVDEETGEIIDIDRLSELDMEYNQKIENIAKYIKNLDSDAEAFKKQKQAFADMQKSAENKRDSLKRYLANWLPKEKWSAADKSVNISWRKSESVNVLNEELLPSEYKTIKTETVPDKTAIKKAIKDGLTIEGAELIESQNLQIK